MASGVTLQKGRFSAALLEAIEEHYRGVAGGQAYTGTRWTEWKHNPQIVVFLAKQNEHTIGWIVYDMSRSTIEELLVHGSLRRKGVEGHILDALLARESLVAAELLASDEERYQWMLDYGFRPTRRFIACDVPMIRMDLSTSVLRQKLEGCLPARTYRRPERVAIERVPATQTDDEISMGLRNLIDKLGGLSRFVKPGQSVVIKPNLVADHGIKDGAWVGGIVTDIRLVRALVELLLPVAGKVIVAEGASINRSETAKMFALYGYDRLVDLDPARVSLVDLNTDAFVEKKVPGGKRMLSRKIPLTLEQADVIINVPVMKTHFAAIASLCVKSLQGAVPPLEKYMSHFFGLWQNLVNIHHLVKPTLHIVDGLTGQEGFGPVSGTPKKMDLLVGGTNPVAVDAVCMRIMGLDPLSSPPVWMAYMQGLGPVEPEKIKVIGPAVSDVASPFSQPEIDVTGGKDIAVHADKACPGCAGYLHFALAKLRKPDPQDPSRQIIDRTFDPKVHIYLGPVNEVPVDPEARNIFMGICQQHHVEFGEHLPGCPPHAEVIMSGIFGLVPDVERAKYADKGEETKLQEMLEELLTMA